MAGKSEVRDGNSQFDWTFDKPGTYEVTFVVDADNHVDESDESNNSTSVAVVLAGPLGCSFVPDQIPLVHKFKEACNKHDTCYVEKGGPDKPLSIKDACDRDFYEEAKASCPQPALACDLAALAYYTGVQLSGKVFFEASHPADRAGTLDAVHVKVARPVG